MTIEPTINLAPQYKDDDLVYVDPDTRTVVGLVEWGKNGNPKPLAMPDKTDGKDPSERRGRGKRFYPWGTYRSMKKVYHLEGKPKKVEANKTLDQVLEKALKEPFWND